MTISEFLDRGREIAGQVETASIDQLKQLSNEWRGYRQHFFDLARDAEVRARLDLINYYSAVSDALDLAIIRRRKK